MAATTTVATRLDSTLLAAVDAVAAHDGASLGYQIQRSDVLRALILRSLPDACAKRGIPFRSPAPAVEAPPAPVFYVPPVVPSPAEVSPAPAVEAPPAEQLSPEQHAPAVEVSPAAEVSPVKRGGASRKGAKVAPVKGRTAKVAPAKRGARKVPS